MTTETTNNQPDFYVYYTEEISKGKTRRIPVGAVWKHGKGEGFNIRLDSLPVRNFDGNLVAFEPLKNDEASQ